MILLLATIVLRKIYVAMINLWCCAIETRDLEPIFISEDPFICAMTTPLGISMASVESTLSMENS